MAKVHLVGNGVEHRKVKRMAATTTAKPIAQSLRLKCTCDHGVQQVRTVREGKAGKAGSSMLQIPEGVDYRHASASPFRWPLRTSTVSGERDVKIIPEVTREDSLPHHGKRSLPEDRRNSPTKNFTSESPKV